MFVLIIYCINFTISQLFSYMMAEFIALREIICSTWFWKNSNFWDMALKRSHRQFFLCFFFFRFYLCSWIYFKISNIFTIFLKKEIFLSDITRYIFICISWCRGLPASCSYQCNCNYVWATYWCLLKPTYGSTCLNRSWHRTHRIYQQFMYKNAWLVRHLLQVTGKFALKRLGSSEQARKPE